MLYLASGRCLFKYWGDECVVYDIYSGDVHLFSYLGAKILQGIECEWSKNQHIEFINQQLSSSLQDEPMDLFEKFSSEFIRLGLVQES